MRLLRRPADDTTVLDDLAAVDQPTDWTDPTAALRDELDQQRIRAEMAEEERDGWKDTARAEADLVDEKQRVIDELLAERDADLARLPQLPGARPVDVRPVDAVLYDALVTSTGVDPGGSEGG